MATARPCGCPASSVALVVDGQRHTDWHASIAPLPRADAATLEAGYGRPSGVVRTYVDDQFDAARRVTA